MTSASIIARVIARSSWPLPLLPPPVPPLSLRVRRTSGTQGNRPHAKSTHTRLQCQHSNVTLSKLENCLRQGKKDLCYMDIVETPGFLQLRKSIWQCVNQPPPQETLCLICVAGHSFFPSQRASRAVRAMLWMELQGILGSGNDLGGKERGAVRD